MAAPAAVAAAAGAAAATPEANPATCRLVTFVAVLGAAKLVREVGEEEEEAGLEAASYPEIENPPVLQFLALISESGL